MKEKNKEIDRQIDTVDRYFRQIGREMCKKGRL